MLGNYPPVALETVMVNKLSTNTNELKPFELGLLFYPMDNTVEMNFRYIANNITLVMSQKSREAMLAAMQTYIDNYQANVLTPKQDFSKAYFGKTWVMMSWGILAPAYYSVIEPRFEYHYVTEEKPYFIFVNASAPETDSKGYYVKDGTNSPSVCIAFSPIQCRRIIELINQDALLAIVKKLDDEAAQFDIPQDAVKPADGTEPSAEPKPLF